MQTPIEFAMTFLLNAFWQVPLIALTAAVCARLLSGTSPRYRYLLWVTALVLSLFLPVVTSVWSSVPELFEPQYTRVLSVEEITAKTFDLPALEPIVQESPAVPFFSVPIVLAIAIFAAYVLFVLYRSAELLRAWIRTRAIARSAYRAELPESIAAALERCRSVIGERKAEILFSDRVPVPVTIGNRRPVVILPEHFLQETDPDVLITALGHELVHVERRDYVFNLLFEITLLPLSFHPAAAYAKRRIAHMRELCCDEIVATRLLKAEAYARSLLNIAGSAPALNLSPIITVGITDADLEVRIMSLLKRSELSFRKKAFLIGAAGILLTIPLMAAAFISPSVTVNSADPQPEVQPTPPVEEEKVSREKASREDLELVVQKIKREFLKSKLEEVMKAQADPNLTDRQKVELQVMESKLRHELKESEEVGYSDEVTREKRERLLEERLEKEKLVESANIKIGQAMSIALDANPGKVIEKGVGKLNDEVVYKFLIRDTTETPERNAVFVVVSGVDGRIIKTENALVKDRTNDGMKRREIIVKKNPNDN